MSTASQADYEGGLKIMMKIYISENDKLSRVCQLYECKNTENAKEHHLRLFSSCRAQQGIVVTVVAKLATDKVGRQ